MNFELIFQKCCKILKRQFVPLGGLTASKSPPTRGDSVQQYGSHIKQLWISQTNRYFNFYLFLIITKWQIKNTNGIDLRLRVIYKYGFRLGCMYWSWWLQGLHDDIYETNQNVFLDSPVVSTAGVKRLQNTFNWKKKSFLFS